MNVATLIENLYNSVTYIIKMKCHKLATTDSVDRYTEKIRCIIEDVDERLKKKNKYSIIIIDILFVRIQFIV